MRPPETRLSLLSHSHYLSLKASKMSQAQAVVPGNNSPYSDLPPIISELLAAKARKGLTFSDIGEHINKDEVWVASAFYGQDELKSVAELLEVSPITALAALGNHWWPSRGLGPIPPHDPVIYRLFEGVLVYGQPIKAIIHEKFGDGIMSMIDCKINIDRKPDPKGDRVVLTFDGKFLPYAKW
ncbi:Cyanase [Pholiota conissans]|uniref:Cyanate hydratase n=1 Tax=Pholiota conissans TaxID=109636 RepID=A0A9P5Z104_9AGAR|nr:Cyanase [Pholiota conissans]